MLVKRKRLVRGGGAYFAAPDDVEFFPSGSKLLDLALGGGWAERRVANIVGDKSSGKTLLCIEACANFARKHQEGKIRYRETERAFQMGYAQTVGLPVNRVDFGEQPYEALEDLWIELEYRANHATKPELFIVDSLDSLPSRAELKRSFGDATYAMERAKLMSEGFRKLIDRLSKHVTLIIVSQIRDNVDPKSFKSYVRAGGKALDFYNSHTVYLASLNKIWREASGVKRPVGVDIRAKIEKNKVGLPFRDADFPLLFGYGIDDISSCMRWLKQTGGFGPENEILGGMKEAAFKQMLKQHEGDWKRAQAKMHKAVEQRWHEIETKFLPTHSKYGT